mgnify:FL=1
MTDTIARLRKGSMIFETMVDLEKAIKFKKGEKIGINEVIRDNAIYSDLKKGMRVGSDVLISAFETDNFQEVVGKIVKRGDLEVTQKFRDEAVETRRKQVVDFLSRNALDARTNRPFTPDMISSALKQAGTKIENQSVEKQINNIIESLSRILPIKIETKKLRVRIPAQHTGKIYGLLQEYKEKEDWLSNGDLEVVLNIPVGLQSDFYDKLNSVTHGSATTQEVKEKTE